MNIIWHGQSCFEILATPAKNSQIKIVTNPFFEETGLRAPKLEADILISTRSDYDNNSVKEVSGNTSDALKKTPFLIYGPGEYEIKNIFIQGITSSAVNALSGKDKKVKEQGEKTIYIIEAEDLKICYLGDLNQKELTEDQLEKIGEIDILMIPVGNLYTLSAKEALKIMAQVEPKITIPMCYALPKLKIKFDGLDKFLKSLGVKSIEPLSKLVVKKKEISTEEAKIVVLKP